MSRPANTVDGHVVPDSVVSLLQDPDWVTGEPVRVDGDRRVWVAPDHRVDGWDAALTDVTGQWVDVHWGYLARWSGIEIEQGWKDEIRSHWGGSAGPVFLGTGPHQRLLDDLVFIGDLVYEEFLVLDYSRGPEPSVARLDGDVWVMISESADEFVAALRDALEERRRMAD